MTYTKNNSSHQPVTDDFAEDLKALRKDLLMAKHLKVANAILARAADELLGSLGIG